MSNNNVEIWFKKCQQTFIKCFNINGLACVFFLDQGLQQNSLKSNQNAGFKEEESSVAYAGICRGHLFSHEQYIVDE